MMTFSSTYNSTTNPSSMRSKRAFLYADFTPFSRPSSTGKELDEETDYGYFGARYYDATLMTGWLSVDPMMDKYPNISPYAYCAWNPVKLVDPDGCDTISQMATNLKNNPIDATTGRDQNTANKQLLDWMTHQQDDPNMVIFLAHGSQTGRIALPNYDNTDNDFINAGAFYTMYINGEWGTNAWDKNIKNDSPTIFLFYSCHTGEGPDSFAKELTCYNDNIITIAPAGIFSATINSWNSKVIRGNNESADWNVFFQGRYITSFDMNPMKWIESLGGAEKAAEFIKDHIDNPWKYRPEW